MISSLIRAARRRIFQSLSRRATCGLFACAAFLAPLAAPAAEEKALVPDKSLQAEAEKLIRQTFKSEYSQSDAAHIAAMAEKFIKLAVESERDPAARYVLLREARDLSTGAGLAERSFQAVDAMAGIFAIDPFDMKLSLLTPILKAIRAPAGFKELAQTLLSAAGEAMVEDNLAAAGKFLQTASTAADKAREPQLNQEVQTLKADLALLQKEFTRMEKASKTLLTSPNDPEANWVMGRYWALLKGKLDTAMTPLSRCSEAAIQDAVKKDMEGARSSAEQTALGRAWLDLLEKDNGFTRDRKKLPVQFYFFSKAVEARAAYWLERAARDLSGLEKEGVLKLLESVARNLETDVHGGSGGGHFQEMAEKPGVLVGLRVSAGNWERNYVIRGLQPIFLTLKGKTTGKVCGKVDEKMREFIAKPGYAIGGLVMKFGGAIDGFQIVFMHFDGRKLDPNDAYTSPWIGGRMGGKETPLNFNGKALIGIRGRHGGNLDALGLIFSP